MRDYVRDMLRAEEIRESEETIVGPKCPECRAEGVEFFGVENFDEYDIVYCSSCGHVYNVMRNDVEIDTES